jgi:hypothetical protein
MRDPYIILSAPRIYGVLQKPLGERRNDRRRCRSWIVVRGGREKGMKSAEG